MPGNQFKENHKNRSFQYAVKKKNKKQNKKGFSILSNLPSEPNRKLTHALDLNMIFHYVLAISMMPGHWEYF